MSLLRCAARCLIAGPLVAEGLEVLRHPADHEAAAAPVMVRLAKITPLPDDPHKCVKVAGQSLVLAGTLVPLPGLGRLGGLTAAAILGPATALGYRFWTVRDRSQRQTMRREFWRHVALTGAALLIATAPRSRRTPRPTA